jgi:dihydroxy-acid dehydratase
LRDRALTLCVADTELARRAQALPPAPPLPERGYRRLFMQSVLQADEGADFDFLRPPQDRGSVPGTG